MNSKKYFLSFLACYIDAEGCIYIRNTKIPQANFTLSSYDKNILFQIWKKLNSLDIISPKPRIGAKKGYTSKKKPLPNTQNYWRLDVHSKSSLTNLFNRISLFVKHESKIKAIQKAIENIKWRNKALENFKVR